MNTSVFAPSSPEPMKRRTAMRGALLACALALASPPTAKAIPTNPDPAHTAAATPWTNVAIAVLNAAVDQHQHRGSVGFVVEK